MIARHSFEQSGDGEGVEVVANRECCDDVHGEGQYTEKHIHLSTYGHISLLISSTSTIFIDNLIVYSPFPLSFSICAISSLIFFSCSCDVDFIQPAALLDTSHLP